jgi:hypothetical protein
VAGAVDMRKTYSSKASVWQEESNSLPPRPEAIFQPLLTVDYQDQGEALEHPLILSGQRINEASSVFVLQPFLPFHFDKTHLHLPTPLLSKRYAVLVIFRQAVRMKKPCFPNHGQVDEGRTMPLDIVRLQPRKWVRRASTGNGKASPISLANIAPPSSHHCRLIPDLLISDEPMVKPDYEITDNGETAGPEGGYRLADGLTTMVCIQMITFPLS